MESGLWVRCRLRGRDCMNGKLMHRVDRKSTRLNSSHLPYTTLFRSVVHERQVLAFVLVEINYDLITLRHGDNESAGCLGRGEIASIGANNDEWNPDFGCGVGYEVETV